MIHIKYMHLSTPYKEDSSEEGEEGNSFRRDTQRNSTLVIYSFKKPGAILTK